MSGVLEWSAITIASFIVKSAVYLMVHAIGRLLSVVKVRRRQPVIQGHVHKVAASLSL